MLLWRSSAPYLASATDSRPECPHVSNCRKSWSRNDWPPVSAPSACSSTTFSNPGPSSLSKAGRRQGRRGTTAKIPAASERASVSSHALKGPRRRTPSTGWTAVLTSTRQADDVLGLKNDATVVVLLISLVIPHHRERRGPRSAQLGR